MTARSEAGRELVELATARAELDDRLDALSDQQRQASEEVVHAGAALAHLERRAASGEDVSAAQRQKAEAALTKARVAAAEPWAERRSGLSAAVRDADAAIARFVRERWEALIGELHEDAEAAASEVDRACERLLEAFDRRMEVERRVVSLASWVRPVRPGDVGRTKAEAAVGEARRLLRAGGEGAPLLAVDPRHPRHAVPIPETPQPDPDPLPVR
jgi:hypothetical protein